MWSPNIGKLPELQQTQQDIADAPHESTPKVMMQLMQHCTPIFHTDGDSPSFIQASSPLKESRGVGECVQDQALKWIGTIPDNPVPVRGSPRGMGWHPCGQGSRYWATTKPPVGIGGGGGGGGGALQGKAVLTNKISYFGKKIAFCQRFLRETVCFCLAITWPPRILLASLRSRTQSGGQVRGGHGAAV